MHVAAICLFASIAFAQTDVLLQKVEPDFGADASKPKVLLPLTIDFVVQPDGAPYSAESRGSTFPHAVALAFAKYRFRPAEKPYSISLTINIPHIVEEYGGTRRTEASISPDIQKDAAALNTKKALDKEGRLKDTLGSVEDRSAIVLFAASQSDPQLLSLWLRQILWLVRNQPQAAILRTAAATLNRAQSPEGYETVTRLWLELVSKTPRNLVLLEAASNWMRLSNPEEVEKMLRPYAGSTVSVGAWLGEAYMFAGLGVTSLGSESSPPTTLDRSLPDTVFARAARSTLAASSDLPTLTSAFATLLSLDRAWADHQLRLPEDFKPLCESVRARIAGLKPNFYGSCQFSEPRQPGEASAISRGGITKQTRPVYPPAAQARRIQGMVTLGATIGKDGKIKSLGLISGPLALYEAAYNAVRQWEYKPYTLAGRAVEVSAEIEVNFAL